MRHLEQLPIWRDANRLLVMLEQAVQNFSRYHKYTVGTDLRRQAMEICRLVGRVYHDKPHQVEHIGHLVQAVDDIKVTIYLGKELKAFRNFVEFEAIARLAVAVGRQGGGWRKHLGFTNVA